MHKILAAFILAIGLATPAAAQNAEVESTIQRQIEAFRADDFERAFTFASPTIQGIFRNSDNFGGMVRHGYPMVWRPADVQFLELDGTGSTLHQFVQITDAEGRVFVLDYEMVLLDSGWKINGVRIVEQSAISA